MPSFQNHQTYGQMPAVNGTLPSLPAGACNGSLADDDSLSPPAWKRGFDIFAILISSPIWLPVMICLSVWIKMVSRGPVFFKQERIGLRGKRFMILKFRSMKLHAETDSHEEHFDRLVDRDEPMTKMDAGDERVILSGRFLRATGLDELPQLFNVLQGEMSLVGPRPCTEHELAKYRMEQLERFDACPGLTGYWQINGKNKTTFSRMIELDVFYARHASPRLDMAILLRTIPAVLAQVRETRNAREPHDKA